MTMQLPGEQLVTRLWATVDKAVKGMLPSPERWLHSIAIAFTSCGESCWCAHDAWSSKARGFRRSGRVRSPPRERRGA